MEEFLGFCIIVLVILIVVLFTKCGDLKSKLRELEYMYKEQLDNNNHYYIIIRNIDQRLGILEKESGHKPKTISETINEIPVIQPSAQRTAALKPKQMPMQQHKMPVYNNVVYDTARVNVPVTASRPVNTSKVNTPAAESTTVNTAKVNTPAAESTTVDIENAYTPAAQSTVNTSAVRTPAYTHQNTAQNSLPRISPEKDDNSVKSVESWLGTKLFNIIASLLIFTGLVLFCTLAYDYITDGMKIAAMFVVSTAFAALGGYLTRKNRSVFSLGLTGCGFGSFFISILVTHIYFHAIGDVIAFSMLLLWIVAALFMSKKLDSLMLSVTAHLGMAVSVCLSFTFGFSADKLILPIIYEFASIAVIIIGNIICYKKTYRFGLFMSMAMMIYSSLVMCLTFHEQNVSDASFAVLALFGVQALAISFISYLISISTAALDKEYEKESNIPLYIHILNKILWCAGIIETFGFSVSLITRNSNHLLFACAALCAAIIAHLAVTLFISEKLNFNETLSRLSIGILSVFMTILLFMQCSLRDTLHGYPFIFVFAGLLMLTVKFTRINKLNGLITALLGCEMIFMCFNGYLNAHNMILSLLYMIAVGGIIFLHWFGQDGKNKEKWLITFKFVEYFWLYASIIPINLSDKTANTPSLIAAEFAILGIITSFVKYSKENETPLRITIRVTNIISLLITYFVLALEYSQNTSMAVKVILIASSLILTIIQTYKLICTKTAPLQLLAASLPAAFLTVVCVNLSPIFIPAYIVTMVLSCEPFFLFTSIFAVIIYSKNKDIILAKLLCIPFGVDLIYMLLTGYRDLCHTTKIFDYTFKFNLGYLGILHLIITFCILKYIWQSQENAVENKNFVTSLKALGYYQLIIFSSILCILLVKHVSPYMVIVPIICFINIFAIPTNFGKFRIPEPKQLIPTNLDGAIFITSCITLFGAMILLYQRIGAADHIYFAYALRFILIILTLALYYLLARIVFKEESKSAHIVLGITFTVLANIILHGLMTASDAAYIYTALTMVIALMSIVIGFKFRSKSLRIYGLILSMLCVLKLGIFDIGSENSLARVGAFVIGGIICFIISGIYNAVEKRLSTKSDNSDISK
ncbi:MAG: DUF2339 domain-containing protein [Clostridia bacterium]|nr:DUF2339 domain-containing protein [Clostridia bacterium]